MPLYKVNFDRKTPISAREITTEHYDSLKEFETKDGLTIIKWYIVSADSEDQAKEIAGKLVYQIWGHLLS
jgi:hypothetical protein